MRLWRQLIAGLAAAAALGVPALSRAAGPLALGAGQRPAVALDASGTAYIAWAGNESTGSSLQFCRLPVGAASCDIRHALPAPGDSVTPPFVSVEGSTVRVLQYRYGLTNGLTPDGFAAVYLFTSSDRGVTFDSGTQVGTVPFTDAVSGPGGGVSLVTNAVTDGELYQRVPTDGSQPVTADALLSTDHPYVGTVALLDPATPLVVFDDGSGNGQFRRYSGAGDLNNAASWTPAHDIGHTDYPHLAGGPSGVFLLDAPASNRIEVRRFTGSGFTTGVAIPDGTGEIPQDYLAEDPGGMLHVLLPQITASCCVLLYGFSPDGASWSTTHFHVASLPTNARAAFAADHTGIAVWYAGSTATVFALRLTPTVPAPVTRTVSAAIEAAKSELSHLDTAAALRTGSIKLPVRVRTAGALSLKMVAAKNARLPRAVKKGTILAHGRAVARHAGRMSLELRLTTAGKAVLRRLGGALPVQLTAGFLTPQGDSYLRTRPARIRPRHHAHA
jgi:hypothetical protein